MGRWRHAAGGGVLVAFMALGFGSGLSKPCACGARLCCTARLKVVVSAVVGGWIRRLF